MADLVINLVRDNSNSQKHAEARIIAKELYEDQTDNGYIDGSPTQRLINQLYTAETNPNYTGDRSKVRAERYRLQNLDRFMQYSPMLNFQRIAAQDPLVQSYIKEMQEDGTGPKLEINWDQFKQTKPAKPEEVRTIPKKSDSRQNDTRVKEQTEKFISKTEHQMREATQERENSRIQTFLSIAAG